MDKRTVQEAVITLQQEGESPSVRKIHALVGGSFRDIQRWLHELRGNGVVDPVTTTEEVEEEDLLMIATDPEPTTTTPGKIPQVRQVVTVLDDYLRE